ACTAPVSTLAGWVVMLPVLRSCCAPLLFEDRLQFARGDRQAVDEEDEVDRPLVASLRREVHLPGHTQPHLLVLLGHGLVQRRHWLELAHPEMRRRPARVGELPTQHIDRATA